MRENFKNTKFQTADDIVLPATLTKSNSHRHRKASREIANTFVIKEDQNKKEEGIVEDKIKKIGRPNFLKLNSEIPDKQKERRLTLTVGDLDQGLNNQDA